MAWGLGVPTRVSGGSESLSVPAEEVFAVVVAEQEGDAGQVGA